MEYNGQATTTGINAIVRQIHADQSPPVRCHHSLVSYRNDLFLFGGINRKGARLDDFWHFSTDSEKWKQLKLLKGPTPRHSHQAVVVDRKMLVFGGVYGDEHPSSELYSFDFDYMTWELARVLYAYRSGHSMVALDKHVIIFGGLDEHNKLSNKIFSISIPSFDMFPVGCKYDLKPRKYASMIAHDSVIYIYGGEADTILGDFYRVRVNSSLTSVEVEQLTVPSMIPALKGATLSVSPINSTHLMLFGGSFNSSSSSTSSTPNTRVFTFSTVTEEWHEAVEFSEIKSMPARLYHQTCPIGRTMYVFGGQSPDVRSNLLLNDLWSIGDVSLYGDSTRTMSDLPYEIWAVILQQVDVKDLVSVSVASKMLMKAIRSDSTLTRTMKYWIDINNIEVPSLDKGINIIVIGDTGVGKSSSVLQFITSCFVSQHDPTIEDCYMTSITIKGKKYQCEVLDTSCFLEEARSKAYRVFRNEFSIRTHGVYAVYDITRPTTLTELDQYLEKFVAMKESICPVIIVGNKTDLDAQRKVSQQEGQDFAMKHGALWTETTSKSTESIQKAFVQLSSHIVKLANKKMKIEVNGDNHNDKKKERCSTM